MLDAVIAKLVTNDGACRPRLLRCGVVAAAVAATRIAAASVEAASTNRNAMGKHLLKSLALAMAPTRYMLRGARRLLAVAEATGTAIAATTLLASVAVASTAVSEKSKNW